jgi:hypothetical protein
MKSLSQSEYGELRSLYQQVYVSTDEILVDDLSEEVVEEIFNELVEEYVSEGYETEEVLDVVEEAALDFIEAKVTYGHDTEAPKAPEKKSMLKGRIRYAKRKAGEAVKAGKEKVKTAKAVGSIAASIAKDEARRAGRAGQQAVAGAVQKKKEQVKKGVRGLIGKGLRKAASAVGSVASKASSAAARLGEENVKEGYGAPGHNPGSGEKSVARAKALMDKQGKKGAPGLDAMAAAKKEHEARRGVKKEDLEATGLFTSKEIEKIVEAEMSEGYKEIDAKKHGRMYDRYKKLRTAAMKDADETGEASGDNRYKMGKMQGVISKSAENLRNKG